MKPEDAINLLDNICSQVNLNREAHAKVQEAIAVLRKQIKKDKE